MSTGTTPRCIDCKHRDLENIAGFSCKAFPEEIPEEILLGEDDHSKPVAGQVGNFVYEKHD
jgi:hypothetical protein